MALDSYIHDGIELTLTVAFLALALTIGVAGVSYIDNNNQRAVRMEQARDYVNIEAVISDPDLTVYDMYNTIVHYMDEFDFIVVNESDPVAGEIIKTKDLATNELMSVTVKNKLFSGQLKMKTTDWYEMKYFNDDDSTLEYIKFYVQDA